jgi:hypothetical protein
MPYEIVNENGKHCVKKKDGEVMKCYDSPKDAQDYLKALYANVRTSEVPTFSMSITKASYDKFNSTPRHWRAVDSDIDKDLYDEQMSTELFDDFTNRINNETPVPEEFKSVICEDTWCGGMPYLSIAHYKAGESGKNVPGKIEAIYKDGNKLKSKGTLDDTPLGRQVFDALCEDAIKQKSGEQDHLPVRISIGFLDLQHKHVAVQGGQEFTFTRKGLGQICPLCEQGIGGKIYLKGQLVHLALTRVPVNPRTEMVAEKSMDAIVTKKDDAKSIVKELADELDERSLAEGTLVVRANDGTGVGTFPVPDDDIFKVCYDPNTDSYNQECLNKTLVANMVELRKQMTPVKSQVDEVVEEAKRKDVTPADKKAAEKEYGKVAYADETNKKYPIDTEEHIRAAWNYIHQARNAGKYPDGGKAIKGKIVSAWKRVIGGEPPSVEKSLLEASMAGETVEKMVLGGESVPEKKFEYMGIDGDPGNNITANPLPEKAKADKEDEADAGDDEVAEGEKPMKKKSELDAEYAELKSLLESGATKEEINQKFSSFASVAEKSYAPKQTPIDMTNLAEVIKSAVSQAVQPLQIEIAQLKAQGVTNRAGANQVPTPRSLTLKPSDLLMKAQTGQSNQPVRKLSQIEMLARKSTGAYVPEQ